MTQDSKASVSKASSEGNKTREKDKSLQTKVVIRRLPPTMTEKQFLDQISPVPASDYMYFVKSDPSLGINSFCRAYINFLNQEDIFIFKEKFDTYVFVDSKGNEFPAIVEFAPFQKIPKKRSKKRDAKCGTLESDPDYAKFLESLENPEEEVSLPSAETYLEEIEAREKEPKGPKQTTPLIEYLKQRKVERQRIKDEKREERRRKELERKKAREEERRKRKSDPEAKETSKKEGDESLKLTLLRNPEREESTHKSRSSQHHGFSSAQKDYPVPRAGYNRTDRVKKNEKHSDKGKSEKNSTLAPREKNKMQREEQNKFQKDSSSGKSGSSASKYSIISEDPAVLAASIEKPKKNSNNNDSNDEGNNNADLSKDKGEGKDPRTERRIKNKDRPSLEIYRPGMRRMSTQRSSPQKETPSVNNSGTSSPAEASPPDNPLDKEDH